jgi:hypothetical protein
MTKLGSSSEHHATGFGEWKVWFEWGSATVDDPAGGVRPAWFLRRGSEPRETVPAIGLTGGDFRRRFGVLLDELTVRAVWRDFEPRVAKTFLGSVLTPRPSR